MPGAFYLITTAVFRQFTPQPSLAATRTKQMRPDQRKQNWFGEFDRTMVRATSKPSSGGPAPPMQTYMCLGLFLNSGMVCLLTQEVLTQRAAVCVS